MNIEFTSPALYDLEELRTWYQPRSKRGLANMLTEIQETITRIPDQISSGRPTPRDDVREKITPTYGFIIPYYICDNTVYILRIYRGMRKPLDYDEIVQLD